MTRQCDKTNPPKQNSSPKRTEAITATSKVCSGRYIETNTGPALSMTHVCSANAIAEATTPCNHQEGVRKRKQKLKQKLQVYDALDGNLV